MPVTSGDPNMYIFLEMGALDEIACLLGLTDETRARRDRGQALVARMIEHIWDDHIGAFATLRDAEAIPVLTPFNLYPL
jgi:hypothetical protein